MFGIVGSSNITRPAFSTSDPWNYESDVLLWMSGNRAAKSVAEDVLADLGESVSVFRGRYDLEKNGMVSIRRKLDWLWNTIMNEQYDELQL